MSFFDELWREAKVTVGRRRSSLSGSSSSMATKRPSSLYERPAGAQGLTVTEDDSGWDLVERKPKPKPKPKQAERSAPHEDAEARGSAGYLVGGEVEEDEHYRQVWNLPSPQPLTIAPLVSDSHFGADASAPSRAHIGASAGAPSSGGGGGGGAGQPLSAVAARTPHERPASAAATVVPPPESEEPMPSATPQPMLPPNGDGHEHCASNEPSSLAGRTAAAAIAPSPPPPPLAAAGPAPSAEVTNSCTASGLAPQPAVQARSDPLPVAAELPPPAAAELPPPPSSPVIAASAGADAGMVIGAAAPSAGLAEGMASTGTGLQRVDARQPPGVHGMPPEAVADIMAMDAGDGNSNEGLHRRRTASCAMPPPASGGHATPSHDAATANGADDDVAAAPQPVDARPSSVSGTLRLLYAACRHLVTFAVWLVMASRHLAAGLFHAHQPLLLYKHLLGSPHWRKCVAQCLVLDVVLFRGLLFCYQAILPRVCDSLLGTQLTHSAAYEWAILLGWALPAYIICEIATMKLHSKMAMQIGPAPPGGAAGDSISSSVYRLLVYYVAYFGLARVVSCVPLVGLPASLVIIALLHSYDSFDPHLERDGQSVDARYDLIDSHWLYFSGYGGVLALLSLSYPSLFDLFVFRAILCPLYIANAPHAAVARYATDRLPIFRVLRQIIDSFLQLAELKITS